jgi:cytochrome P450
MQRSDTQAESTVHPLSLPEELALMLLNEESGYFHQVPGWSLNCTVIGAVLAELSLRYRIDTDSESLFLVDKSPTGLAILDPILAEIADEPEQRSTRYWIERLAPRAETIVDTVLNDLVRLQFLEHHEGDFWTLARAAWEKDTHTDSEAGGGVVSIKTRVHEVILGGDIPDPRDAISIALLNACNVIRFMLTLDEEAEERIKFVCQLDVIGRSISDAVSSSIVGVHLQQSVITKKIRRVALRRMLFNRHTRSGNLPALFADLAKYYGPVFELSPPLSKKSYIFLAGAETNHWMQRSGRLYLHSGEYLAGIEKVYGVTRTVHSTDGADHFKFRKALRSSYAPSTLLRRLDEVYHNARKHMSSWDVGDVHARSSFRLLMNTQMSPLLVSQDTQDSVTNLLKFKERALSTHVANAMPKFMLKTPRMRRLGKLNEQVVKRIEADHTPGQRQGCPADIMDGYFALHANEPQFLRETDFSFPLGTALLTGMYLADMTSFTLYFMLSNPDVYERVQAEADALFADGDPSGEDLKPDKIDVTHRVLLEALRLTPITAFTMRNVMNSCNVAGYDLPLRARIVIAQTAAHYMEDLFPDPFTFDIDRYLPPRNEHLSSSYAPYGLGTHKCMGMRWAEIHIAINILMLAHYFTFELSKPNRKLRINSFPTMSPSKRLKFTIKEKRHQIPAQQPA